MLTVPHEARHGRAWCHARGGCPSRRRLAARASPGCRALADGAPAPGWGRTAAPPRAGDGLSDGAAGAGGDGGSGAEDGALDEEALPSTLFFGVRGEQARAGLRSHAQQAGR